MMRIHITPARPNDAPQVGHILSGWVDETDWLPRIHSHGEDQGHAAELVRRGWVSVARQGGRVVGFLAREAGDIHALYVVQDARGHNVGKALLEHAKQATDHLSLWTFQANIGAQAFYLREGFCEVERTDGADNDEGLPDIRYEWKRQ